MGIVLRAGAVSLPRDTILSLSGASVGVGLISDVPSEVGTLVDKPLFGVALSATELGWKNYNNRMLEKNPEFFGNTRFLCEGSYGVGHALLVGGCAAADVDNGIIRFFAC